MQKVWKLKQPSPKVSLLAHETKISFLQARLLINRGITDKDSIASFLTPRLSELMNPMLLKDMDLAVDQITRSIVNRESITIYGDYDADGLTSTALLLNFFSDLGIKVSHYIPNRLTEGYSLNPEAIKSIAENGCRLIITVDCGTSNVKELELAKHLGMEVVVTDHHQVPDYFKPVCAVINPHRLDSEFPFKDLAGVGVAFFLAIAIRSALREKRWFENIPEPDLKQYLDLVALGTVADMVPLIGQNRILAKSGIERMKQSCRPGIRSMGEISGIDIPSISSTDLAFKLAPRLNASGRMGEAETGITALTIDEQVISREVATHLNKLNGRRQKIEGQIIDQIEKSIMPMEDLKSRKTLVFSGDDWHRGVLGIVASRLVEKYHRPTLIISLRDGIAVGSGRSIAGFNLYSALSNLKSLFNKFGGHYHAVGFTINASKVDILSRKLEILALDLFNNDDMMPAAIKVDAEMDLRDITWETIRQIESLAPFGSANPEPVFYAHSLKIIKSSVVGENHLKLKVRQGEKIMEAIGFGLSKRYPLESKNINMVFTPHVNRWRGYKAIQLKIIDLGTEKLPLSSQSIH